MKLKLFLTAGGNPSLLVWNCPQALKKQIINKYLGKKAEQVGFITNGNVPKLEMMGYELCINSTLALASYLGGSGELQTSGVKQKVNYINSENGISIFLPLQFTRKDNVVLFEGIGFICKKEGSEPNKKELIYLSQKYNLPAFGVILYKKNQSKPFVYVRDTDSLTAETACGSGSIALSLITGLKNIIQPSGGIISVTKNGDQFKIEAKVKEINLKGGEKYENR